MGDLTRRIEALESFYEGVISLAREVGLLGVTEEIPRTRRHRRTKAEIEAERTDQAIRRQSEEIKMEAVRKPLEESEPPHEEGISGVLGRPGLRAGSKRARV